MNRQVYFAAAGQNGPVKIGLTRDIKQRLAALQTACPADIVFLAAAPGSAEHEKYLHQRFATSRLNGEWFSRTEELLAFVESVKDRSFSWPASLEIVRPESRQEIDLSNLNSIIRACGGALAISRASPRRLTPDAVYKWRKIGCPNWHWPTLISLSGVSTSQMHAANCVVRGQTS